MASGTWTVVNPAVTHRRHCGSWGYEQSAMGVVAGRDNVGNTSTAEDYNGISWQSSNSCNQARKYCAGGGSLSAGAFWGGTTTVAVDTTEEYDGTSWATVNSLNSVREYCGGSGRAQNACLCWSAKDPSSANDTTEEYDGTSWSAGGAFIAAVDGEMGGSGAQNNTISIGGNADTDNASSYDGTSWSVLSNTLRQHNLGSAAGHPAAALAIGQYPDTADADKTDEFNGTSWIAEGDLNETKGAGNRTAGSQQLAVVTVGQESGPFAPSQQTEEWDDIPVCWNYTAHYKDSNRLFKLSGCGPYPKYLNVPSNVDKSTGKLIDDGKEINPDEYEVK